MADGNHGDEVAKAALLDPEVLALRPRFLANRRAELQEVVRLLAIGGFPELKRIGHNLKGSGESYGYPELAAIGRRMENAGAAQDLGALQSACADLAEFLTTAT